jgi:hypothetical protein
MVYIRIDLQHEIYTVFNAELVNVKIGWHCPYFKEFIPKSMEKFKQMRPHVFSYFVSSQEPEPAKYIR